MLITLQTNPPSRHNSSTNLSKDSTTYRNPISLRSPTFKENSTNPNPQSGRLPNLSGVPSPAIPTGPAAERHGRNFSDGSNRHDRKGSEPSSSEPPSARRPLPPQNQVRPPSVKRKDVNPFIIPKRMKRWWGMVTHYQAAESVPVFLCISSAHYASLGAYRYALMANFSAHRIMHPGVSWLLLQYLIRITCISVGVVLNRFDWLPVFKIYFRGINEPCWFSYLGSLLTTILADSVVSAFGIWQIFDGNQLVSLLFPSDVGYNTTTPFIISSTSNNRLITALFALLAFLHSQISCTRTDIVLKRILHANDPYPHIAKPQVSQPRTGMSQVLSLEPASDNPLISSLAHPNNGKTTSWSFPKRTMQRVHCIYTWEV